MARVPIGDLVDTDVSQYSFTRDSKLPRDTFAERSDHWGDRFVLAVCAVAAVFVVLMIAGVIA